MGLDKTGINVYNRFVTVDKDIKLYKILDIL